MATATKALASLRDEGLVAAVPGVGTVVAPLAEPRPATPPSGASGTHRAGRAHTQLDAHRVASVAVAIADAEGLAAVSMRRLAGELGVATMSLYRHVADKDALVLRMMDTVFTAWRLPDDPPESPRDRLELAARRLWSAFRAHPWLAPAMSLTRPQLVASVLPYTEWVLTALDGSGMDVQDMFTAQITLFNYVRGTAVNLESETEAVAASGLDSEEWLRTQEPTLRTLVASGQFPRFSRLTGGGYDFDLDSLFEFGLQRLLDGIVTFVRADAV